MSWPPNAQPGGTYILQPYDQSFATPNMVLPDNFTIKLPPDWPKDALGQYQDLKWFVTQSLTFGTNCVIDLSPQEPVPLQPPKAPSGANGNTGKDGGDGTVGVDGAESMTGVDLLLSIQTWAASGSLWIKIDGSSGGPGGDGGNGGGGGNGKCDWLGFGGPNGGNGGDGGDGGRGGKGGDTSRVQIEYGVAPAGVPLPVASCIGDGKCGGYPAPPASNDGTIRVYGSPGCGGSGGRGGRGGNGGQGDNCGFGRPDRQPGNAGKNGGSGNEVGPLQKCFVGPNGACRASGGDILIMRLPKGVHAQVSVPVHPS